MALLNSQVLTFLESSKRNCGRCGKDFIVYEHVGGGPARVCRACRIPKIKCSNVLDRAILGKPLTLRQNQIVAMVAEGRQNKEIAFRLYLSQGTVKIYVSQIFRKTGMTNRTELARWWILNSDNQPISE